MLPDTLDDDVIDYMRERKLERKSAWEQLRAAFAQIHDIGGPRPLEFCIPATYCVRPVRPGEVRIHTRSGFGLYNTSEGKLNLELPMNASSADFPVLSIDADQGSVGYAWEAFAGGGLGGLFNKGSASGGHWRDVRG